MEYPKYSDIKKQLVVFPGVERIELAQVLNKEIIIKDFKALPSTLSQGREFVVVLAELDGKTISFSSGEVVLKQLTDVKEKLPIKATITRNKGKRYYTLV